MGKVDGKVAIVTGSAMGIGKAIALLLAAEGGKVVIADRILKEGGHPFLSGSAETTVSEIEAAGGIALAVQADMSKEEDCDNVVAKTKKVFGPADILVNNAAYTLFTKVMDCPTKKWVKLYMVSQYGYFMMCQKVLPGMIEQRSGAIVNITSPVAAGPGRGPYKASGGGDAWYGAGKAAVERFTQGLAQEMYQYGISVTALGPSQAVATPGAVYLLNRMVEDGIRQSVPADTYEPVEVMAKATLLLATGPLDKVTGRVTYSQAILKEFGWITEGKGSGIDSPGSGYSQI